MIARRTLRFSILGIIALVILSLYSAVAAANSVPTTHIDYLTQPITANDLKPSACNGLNLTAVREGNGTNGNDLVLGTAGNDNMNAQGGDDCVVAGDGADRPRGGMGHDVILAGDGDDALDGGRGDDTLYGQSGDDDLSGGRDTDVCDGGSGTDTSDGSCETEFNIP
jgi:hypothetical protein